MMQAPMAVLSASTKRETGKKAQFGNIAAAKVRLARRPQNTGNLTKLQERLVLICSAEPSKSAL